MNRYFTTGSTKINGITIVPLERESIDCIKQNRGYLFKSMRSVTGVVIAQQGHIKAYNADGEEMLLSSTIEQYEGLHETLENL